MPENTAEIMSRASRLGLAVPAFNVPYLPMIGPVVEALRSARAFGLIQVARLEWMKFEAGGLKAVRDAYAVLCDERFTRLHLDHVPVLDEDNKAVDYEAVISEAIRLGYSSVMVDGSRLPLEENIAATKKVVALARRARDPVPVEAELGAVLGHESGPLPPYEELFRSLRGFTDPAQAARFAAETGADWLSVAVGNIHGAIIGAARSAKKIQARLDLEHLSRIRSAVPNTVIVLHGGSGIRKEHVLSGVARGITKINIATTLRQAYESGLKNSVESAKNFVYQAASSVIREDLEIEGSADILGTA